MENEILDLAVHWAVPAILGALAGWLYSYTRRTRAELKALNNGVMTLLRSRLVDIHEDYVVAGIPCPDTIKREADQVYEAYHGLGGNGIGTHYYQEIINAPVGAERG